MKKPCLLALLLVAAALLWSQTELMTLLKFDSPVDQPTDWGFASMISGEGDLNGDGLNDIVIVGRPTGGVAWSRILYVYLGSTELDSIPDWVIEPTESTGSYSYFGEIVAYNNDLNADGVDDLVIAAPGAGSVQEGRVYIYWGGEYLSATPDVTLYGYDYAPDCFLLGFGCDIDLHGDLNNDGYADLVVGAEGPSLSWEGLAAVFYGGPEFDTIADWQVVGEGSDRLWGWGLSTGDLNGDSVSDLVISSATPDSSFYYPSRFNIFFGGEDFDTEIDYFHDGPFTGFYNTTANGDFNGDGFDDLFLSSGSCLHCMLGSADNSNPLFVIPRLSENVNRRSRFYSHIGDDDLMTISKPMDSILFLITYDPQDTVSVVYTWHGDYNNGGSSEQDYFIGDYNGDGNEDLLLSCKREDGSWYFRILTTEYESVEEHTKPVQACNLSCYPNPCIDRTSICFDILKADHVNVSIYNVRGQLVRRAIADDYYEPGRHQVSWDGRDSHGTPCANGLYLIRLTVGQSYKSAKILLLH